MAGEFAPGERLPTVRQFATDLGVHHNTVAESYRVPAEEGWLDLRRGAGQSHARAREKIGQALEARARRGSFSR